MPLNPGELDTHVWTEAVARDYDRSSAWMFDPAVLDPTVDFLAEQARGGRVLELAIGTGRVALPLAARGCDVAGIELSRPMLEELRRKPGGSDLAVVLGDMATTRVEGSFTLVYVVFNAITNLLTQQAQLRCVENAAAHLAPGGAFVVEVLVPPVRGLPPGETFKPFHVSDEHLGIDELDTVNQLLVSHHYTFRDGVVSRFDSPHRYLWPSELDLMAFHAGLSLEGRWGDWDRSPFTQENTSHVSLWRKPSGPGTPQGSTQGSADRTT